jgi:hypothetical protein
MTDTKVYGLFSRIFQSHEDFELELYFMILESNNSGRQNETFFGCFLIDNALQMLFFRADTKSVFLQHVKFLR